MVSLTSTSLTPATLAERHTNYFERGRVAFCRWNANAQSSPRMMGHVRRVSHATPHLRTYAWGLAPLAGGGTGGTSSALASAIMSCICSPASAIISRVLRTAL